MPRPRNNEAQQYRDKAMLRLCQDLDQSRDQYRIRAREARLTHLIAAHNLQEIYNAGGRNEAHQALTPKHFVSLVQRAASRAGTTSTALYQDGPAALSAAYRRQIGYNPPLPQPPVPGAAGTSTAAGTQNHNQTSTTATNGTQAHPLQPTGQPKLTAPKSTEVISLGDETSESTPATDSTSKKRRVNESDELSTNDRQPKQARTVSASSPDIFDPLNTSNKAPAPSSGGLPTQDVPAPQVQGMSNPGQSERGTGKQPSTEMSNTIGVSGESASAASRKRDRDEVGLDQSDRVQKSRRLAQGSSSDVQNTSRGKEQSASTENRKRDADDAALETSDRAQKRLRLVKAAPLRSRTTEKPVPKLKNWVHITLLGHDKIEEEFRSAWYQTQIFVIRLVGDTDIDETKFAQWMLEPDADLEVLYETVLGEEWRATGRTLNQLKLTRSYEQLEMITAAAMNELVLQQPLPWPGPNEDLAHFSKTANLYNDVLYRMTGALYLEIENVVWQVARNKVQSEEFWNEEIEPRGRNLAEIFWQTLQPQLAYMGGNDPKHADCGPEQWATERLKELTDIFSHALLVKGLMAASPEHYSTYWVPFGTEFDYDTMAKARPREGSVQVAWCVSPMVKVRTHKDSEERRSRKALVFTRKLPAPWVND